MFRSHPISSGFVPGGLGESEIAPLRGRTTLESAYTLRRSAENLLYLMRDVGTIPWIPSTKALVYGPYRGLIESSQILADYLQMYTGTFYSYSSFITPTLIGG
jgi:hypothetical protein